MAITSHGEEHRGCSKEIIGIKCWSATYKLVQLYISAISLLAVVFGGVELASAYDGVVSVAASVSHTCALTTGGGVKCWGSNANGELGNGTTTASLLPVNVIGLASGVTTISAGYDHACALTTSGGVKCWGRNNYGHLGNSTTTNSSIPVNVTGLTSGVVAIGAGTSYTCAITTSGSAKCWGYNNYGQLGNGTTTNSSIPVDVTNMSSGAVSVSAGFSHTCALLAGGGVKCWGRNNFGQLGNGTTTDSSIAVDVTGLSVGVSALANGYYHSCALTTGGGIKCWGQNNYGQLGNATTVNSSTAVDVTGLTSGVATIAAGNSYSCALTTGGGAKCWGYNNYSQLGNGTAVNSSTSVDVANLSSGTLALTAGGSHACAVAAGGILKCWGYNNLGQLGNGSTINSLTPTSIAVLATGVSAVAMRNQVSCAVTAGGGLKCWGYNVYGQLGNGTTTKSASPVDVTGLTSGVATVSIGFEHACALTTSGGVKCWGRNNYGQLGNGNTTNSSTPVDVAGFTSGAAAVSAGNSFTCILTTGGGVKCVGYNAYGQLGNGTTTNNVATVDVTGLTSGVSTVAVGYEHACALTTGAGVKCWGRNNYGQLGNSTTTNSSTAVDVTGLTSGVAAVAGGNSYTCALASSGAAKCWGYNNVGQLGNGTTTNSSTAVDVTGLTSGVAAIATGGPHTCALTTSGSMKCWGANASYGQLGNGTSVNSSIPVDVTGLASGVVTVAAGESNSCATTSAGAVKCWGLNALVGNGYDSTVPGNLAAWTISGNITSTGNPLVGANIYEDSLGVQTTDESGHYAFVLVPSGSYTFVPSKIGYVFGPTTVSIGSLSASAIYDFSATLANYDISGTVTSQGQALSGVTISSDQLGTQTTDALANYHFSNVPAGTYYSIVPSKAGYSITPAYVAGVLSANTTKNFGVPSAGISAIAAGDIHTCTLASNGGVKCWGYNNYGQLGNVSTVSSEIPVDVIGLNSSIAAIAGGTSFTCALTTDGGVKCWGYNASGQLGNGTVTTSTIAVDVTGLTSGVLAIGAGWSHTCAITTGGGLRCWGRNAYGQLGNGTTTNSSSPVNVSGLSSGVLAVALGDNHTCALTTGGGVKCWGYNANGQIGNGIATNSSVPVDVVSLNSSVSAIAADYYHTCALTIGGGLKCWGYNNYGQLGNGSTTNRYIPTNVIGLTSGVVAIATDYYHTCALTEGGGVKCWGYNYFGQLGNGTTTDSSTPVDVTGLTSGVAAINTGYYYSCALTTSSDVKCWGLNNDGQLGDGTTNKSLIPQGVTGLDSGVSMVASGNEHSCALTTGGGIKCWGKNNYGQLGNGNTNNISIPVEPIGLSSGVAAVSTGNSFTCILTTGGGVKCWGYNGFGQLGNGTTSNNLTPVNVTGLTSGVSAISAGYEQACAVTTGGAVKCWGRNNYGQLGNGNTTNSSTPVDVVGLITGVATVATSNSYTCALTTSGGIKCWGYNGYGQLGNGTTTNSSTPVDVTGLTSGVATLATGGSHACALTAVGGVECWGRNIYGRLGDGTTANSSVPVDVTGLSTGVVAISAGITNSCAVTTGGGVKCWGENSYGQLGNGNTTYSAVPVDVNNVTSGMASVAVGSAYSCALSMSGGLKCWGFNNDGELGNSYERSVPVNLSGSTISGTITVDGVPLSGVSVREDSLGLQVTNSSGYYDFVLVQNGSYTLTPYKVGYTFTPISASISNLSGPATRNFSATLTTYEITGSVTHNGQPLSGVAISDNQIGTQFTDSLGNYRFTNVPAGTHYSLVPSKEGRSFTPPITWGVSNSSVTHNFVVTEFDGVSKISTRQHACAVTTSGGVKCWGSNRCGELGNGTDIGSSLPVDVLGLTSDVVEVATGYCYSCALTVGGSVKCWGDNWSGKLGDGTFTSSSTPVDVVGLATSVKQLALGADHTCALDTNGDVKCWGYNSHGELGNGTTSNSATPLTVLGLSPVESIAAHYDHTCAVLTNGGVKCWGYNNYGQLGNGLKTNSTIPVSVLGLTSEISEIAAGDYHTCVLTNDGGVKCWGYNFYGQLGNGATTDNLSPVDVLGLSSGISAISAGQNHTCVLTTDGGLKCWGYNGSSQLGTGTTTSSSAPVDVTGLDSGVTAITAGYSNSCAVTTSGLPKCWGDNNYGQIGDGTKAASFTPQYVPGLESGVLQVSANNDHTCVMTAGGGVKCWGYNPYGQLGNGTTDNSSTPVDVVGLGSGVSSISTGNAHTCALTTSGGVKCWGYNLYGQLGDGTFTSSSAPVDVLGLTSDVAALSVGYFHSCAVTTSGGMTCWGRNNYGQLGDGTTVNSSTPVDGIGLTSGVAAVAGNRYGTCVLTTGGGVKCWGYNANGQLGNGTSSTTNTPTDVTGLTSGVAAIVSSYYHTCALTTAGGAKCWGINWEGELGNGTDDGTLIPVDVLGLSSGVASIAVGTWHSCAVTTEGGVKCWGYNYDGQLGNGSNITSLSPVDVFGLTSGVISIAPGLNHTCALTNQGGVKCWGADFSGALGDGGDSNTPTNVTAWTISGDITEGGSPLPGVSVDAGSLGPQITNEDGHYAFVLVSAANYTLTPSKAGYVFNPISASGQLSGPTVRNFTATRMYTVAGHVAENGNPLQGVSIDGGNLGTQTTDIDGNFSFSLTQGSSYTLTPAKTGYVFSPVSASGSSLSGPAVHNFSATVSLHTLSGIVTNNYQPLSGATVSSSQLGAQTTNSLGRYEYTNIAYGTEYSLALSKSGYSFTPASASGTLRENTEKNFEVDLEHSDSDGDGASNAQEIIDGTDPSDPSDPNSFKNALETTLCTGWNSFFGMYNILEQTNFSDRKFSIATKLYDLVGTKREETQLILKPNRQVDLLVHGMNGYAANSYGSLCSSMSGVEGSFAGRMVYYKHNPESAKIEFALALPLLSPRHGEQVVQFNTFQPSLDAIDADNVVANWIQISNLSDKHQNGTLYLHDYSGSVIHLRAISLPPQGRYDAQVPKFSQPLFGIARFVPEDSKAEFQIRDFRIYYDNISGKDSFNAASSFESVAGTGTLFSAPLDTENASSIVEIANTLNKPVEVEVRMYEATGGEVLFSEQIRLSNYASFHLIADQILNGKKGIVTLQANTAHSIIATVSNYGRTPTLGLRYMYSVQAKEALGTMLAGSYNTFLNQDCQLVLVNPGNSAKNATISLYRYDGVSPVADYVASVPAHGMSVDDICQKDRENVYGTVSVQPETPNSLSGNIIRKGEYDQYRFGTELTSIVTTHPLKPN